MGAVWESDDLSLNLALWLTSCAALDKLFNLSEPYPSSVRQGAGCRLDKGLDAG